MVFGHVAGHRYPSGMARPTTKAELLSAAREEFARLFETVDSVSDADRVTPGASEGWSVKDLLAHLDAWHQMLLGWEAIGRTGETPVIPEAGYTWAQIPALNEAIYQRTRHDDWDEVVSRLRGSHDAVLVVVDSYSNDDLFTKKRFRWTGSTSVGSYAVSTTSSHYLWARTLIRRWAGTR